MKRRQFIGSTAMLGAGILMSKLSLAAETYPVVRVPASQRKFTSKAVEAAIKEFKAKVKNPELGWLFENCFPNTLDTTVTYKTEHGRPDTYVITGDIDAMWLRDSSAQVWPYISFINKDAELKNLVAGVINRQARCIFRPLCQRLL
jgi:meiotically up-regulated gene 157 (Mug157) protein